MRPAWTAAGALIGALVPALAAAQSRDWFAWPPPPAVGMWGLSGLSSLVMLLVMLGFWGLVIAGFVVGLRWLVGVAREGRGERPDKALAILRQRYARGEISREEFEAKRRDLG